jgi:hypothetical protein
MLAFLELTSGTTSLLKLGAPDLKNEVIFGADVLI